MNYGMWLSTTGLQVNDYRQSLIANNLANINTVGFKHDLAVIQERRVESRQPGGRAGADLSPLGNLSGGTTVEPTYHSFVPGSLEQTDQPLDVAINGSGRQFFTVQKGDAVYYTRDGRFTLNPRQELVMAAGDGEHKVLSDAGLPIVLPGFELGSVQIDRDGDVTQGGAPLGRLGVVEFADPNAELRKAGQNLFRAASDDVKPSAVRANVQSGAVERSTVDPVAGLADMIQVTRAYQLNATLLQMQDSLNGEAARTIGRIG